MRTNLTGTFLVLSGIAIVLGGQSALAHDVWITTVEEGGAVLALVHHGHPGDRKTPDVDKLFEFEAIAADQSRQSLLAAVASTVRDGLPVLLTGPLPSSPASGSWLLAARYDNGYWVKTSVGHRNTSKRQIPGGGESLSSMKYAKALVRIGSGPSDFYKSVVGHRLELVPLSDPFSVIPGSSLRVRLLFDGKPLAGAGVEIGDGATPMEEKDIPRYRTDEQGVTALPIKQPGLQVIVVDHFVVSPHPDLADRELHNATLSFVISSPPVR